MEIRATVNEVLEFTFSTMTREEAIEGYFNNLEFAYNTEDEYAMGCALQIMCATITNGNDVQ